jgi:hypothetical protein
VETEWHLFRLLGLSRPAGVSARLDLDWYEAGVLAGVKWDYERETELRRYSGYGRVFALLDGREEDEFGDMRRGVEAPRTRGRLLMRHKEYLPQDWEAQFELSYLCDKNFLEQYWRDEFDAGKEQETLVYAKKQRDNWAFTALLKYRLNRFDTQSESFPDLGLYLIGEPLDELGTFFSESHAGLKRYRPADSSTMAGSDILLRADTRNEINLPFRIGHLKVVPYAVARATYWSDEPDGGENCRLYGQVGARASTTLWKVDQNVTSRLWDLNGLRHIITPELAVFASDLAGASPGDLFPLDPDIEEHLGRQHGFSVGLYTRLQTKRGPAGRQQVVDWMRLNVVAGFYDENTTAMPGDGRFFIYRPEYSLPRHHVNLDYTWNISDATTFLGDLNYDLTRCAVRTAAAGLAVVRSPRLAYYAGMRLLPDMDSAVGTFGLRYRINRKYSISAFEQYDWSYRGGDNLATQVSIVRKFPRWYMALTFTFDQSAGGDDVGVMVTFWPEGIPEVRLGGSRLSLLGRSEEN